MGDREHAHRPIEGNIADAAENAPESAGPDRRLMAAAQKRWLARQSSTAAPVIHRKAVEGGEAAGAAEGGEVGAAEAAHTDQQAPGGEAAGEAPALSEPGDADEKEADEAAEKATGQGE